MTGDAAPRGVYLHIPFCRHRCDYCAFATWTDRGHLEARYLEACRTQIAADLAGGPPVSTVFVGGGTPTLVDPEALVAVLAGIPLTDDAEVTVECNPDDVTVSRLATYAAGGVTRLSIGVQSMVPSVLAALGRTHDPANVRVAAEAAHRVGLPFNLDLIYGVAGETMEQWRTTLDAAVALEPAHVSAYALTVEPGTPLAARPRAHPDDDDQADKYLETTEVLGAAGFEWYEISNWARPGHRCRHNLIYWLGGDYAAIGCAAHGHHDGRRYWNVRTPDRYVKAIEEGTSPVAAGEQLEPDAAVLEALQLLIRTGLGVPAGALDADDASGALHGLVDLVAGVPDDWRAEAQGIEARGIEVATPRYVLTPAGRLLANEVALRLRLPEGPRLVERV